EASLQNEPTLPGTCLCGSPHRRCNQRRLTQRRQTLPRANPIARSNPGKLPLILRQLRSVGVFVPQMKHSGRKRTILAPDAGMKQANDDIRILFAPSAVVCIKAVDTVEVRPPDGEIARTRALPNPLADAAQRSKREVQQGGQAIDTAVSTFVDPACKTPL